MDVADVHLKACRICLKDTEDSYSIFEACTIGEEKHNIEDFLTESTSIEVNAFRNEAISVTFFSFNQLIRRMRSLFPLAYSSTKTMSCRRRFARTAY